MKYYDTSFVYLTLAPEGVSSQVVYIL